MLAQIAKQILPVVPGWRGEQLAMRTVDAKPKFHASEQRTHTGKRKSEIPERLAVTSMHDVDSIRRFGDDRSRVFTQCGRSNRKHRCNQAFQQ